MSDSPVATPVPGQSFPTDWLSEENERSVRARHEQAVERWLDEASFANELFKLHEKYGIDPQDEGYLAYKDHLRKQYETNLLTNGPAVDPLQEGCDCLFCRFDHETVSFRPTAPASAEAATATDPNEPVKKTTPVAASGKETIFEMKMPECRGGKPKAATGKQHRQRATWPRSTHSRYRAAVATAFESRRCWASLPGRGPPRVSALDDGINHRKSLGRTGKQRDHVPARTCRNGASLGPTYEKFGVL